MFRFQHPEVLFLLFIIPIVIILMIWQYIQKKKKLNQIADQNLYLQLIPNVSKYKLSVKTILYVIAFLLAVIALANPQFGLNKEKMKVTGRDVMIALDLSNSMLCEDLQPNRLERSKRFLTRLIENMASDKIGLIVFAGNAFLQTPLTIDHSNIKMNLNASNPKNMPAQGTNLSRAIELAMQNFDEKETTSKSLIIITDGENHDKDAEAMAKQAASKGFRITLIGVGTDAGGPIPYNNEYLKDNEGNTVITKMNPEEMKQIADAGNGNFYHINSINASDAVLAELNKIDKKQSNEIIYANYNSYFQFFALLSIIFLIIEMVISWRKSKIFSNWFFLK